MKHQKSLELSESEKDVLNFGSSITKHKGNIADRLYNIVATKYNENRNGFNSFRRHNDRNKYF